MMKQCSPTLQKDQPSAASCFVKSIRLPMIDSNCIFSNQSVKNKSFPLKSVLSPQSSSIQKSESPRQAKPISNKLSFIHRLKTEFTTAEPIKTQRKRLKTDIRQGQQRGEIKASNRYKGIEQKLLQIAMQLGMHDADYKNYMKSQRSSNQMQKQKKINNLSSQKTIKSYPFSSSKKHKITLQHNLQLKVKSDEQQSHIQNAVISLKQNVKLKLRPVPRTHRKVIKQKQTQMSNKNKERPDPNKSIRGWTKYGKLQQFQY